MKDLGSPCRTTFNQTKKEKEKRKKTEKEKYGKKNYSINAKWKVCLLCCHLGIAKAAHFNIGVFKVKQIEFI